MKSTSCFLQVLDNFSIATMPRKTRQKWKPFDPNVEESSELRRSSRLEAKGPSKRSWAEVASPLKNPKISRYERFHVKTDHFHEKTDRFYAKMDRIYEKWTVFTIKWTVFTKNRSLLRENDSFFRENGPFLCKCNVLRVFVKSN